MSLRPTILDLEKIIALGQTPTDRSLRAPLPEEWNRILTNASFPPFLDLKMLKEKKDITQKLVVSDLAPYADTTQFPHVYWTEGVSSAISWLAGSNTQVYYHRHDYSWLSTFANFQPIKSLNEVPAGSCFYVSQPFSALCEYIDLQELEVRSDLKVFVDLAFWGTLPPEPLNLPSNTAWLALSFSKNLGLWPYRVGLLLAQMEVPRFKAYEEALYLPHMGIHAVSSLLNEFDIFTLGSALRPYQYEVCKRLNLIPTSCPLAGREGAWSYRRSLSSELAEALRRR